MSLARNQGIKISKSNWISFLDSDDEWMKDKLFLQKENLLTDGTVETFGKILTTLDLF